MKRKPLYFNTTNLEGKELQESIRRTLTQDANILQFFRANPTAKLTKYEVLDNLLKANMIHNLTPETSIGRALNTLMRNGYIEKLKEYRVGKYGKRNHLWKLSDN
ncbi:hypothetical protein [Emticicia sp.]|uniref:hypothetical protein n=1 Tax=Emticicia sp. TaxID=1930953 RepID=UPI0037521F22